MLPDSIQKIIGEHFPELKAEVKKDHFENISYPVSESNKADWIDVMVDAFLEKIEHEPRVGRLNRTAILGAIEEIEDDPAFFAMRLKHRLFLEYKRGL
jgi:hypothetical protein